MRSRIYLFLRLLAIPSAEIDSILPKAGNILDLGCGNGPLTVYLSKTYGKRKIVGWDINNKRLGDAKKAEKSNFNLKFENKDVVRNKMPNIKGALASDFLHHISFSDQATTLKKVFRKLSKNGVFLIKEVDKNDLPRYWGSFFFDKLFYFFDKITFRSEEEWLILLRKTGFKNIKVKKSHFWFPASTKLFICTKD